MKRLLTCLLLLAAVAQAQEPLQTAEQQLVQATNVARAQYGLPPLQYDAYLTAAARQHSQEMSQLNYFDHISPVAAQRYPWDRLNATGADSDYVAEDLYFAEGYPISQVAALAVAAWLRSPEHRENLLSHQATRLGPGLFQAGSRIFVTEVFSGEIHPLR